MHMLLFTGTERPGFIGHGFGPTGALLELVSLVGQEAGKGLDRTTLAWPANLDGSHFGGFSKARLQGQAVAPEG